MTSPSANTQPTRNPTSLNPDDAQSATTSEDYISEELASNDDAVTANHSEELSNSTDDAHKQTTLDASMQETETKIIIDSPEPDVAIATVESVDVETSTDISVPTEIVSSNKAQTSTAPDIAATKDIENEDILSVNTEDSDDLNNLNRLVEKGVIDIELEQAPPMPDEDESNDTTSTDDQTESDLQDLEDIEKAEEAVQEKKEAKLESYKQFIAEQFSNQKIDYPEIRVKIEANALPSKMYFVMNILSAIIASYGLVTNSAAVVIGAMLVAMMLGPITGVALAIIDYRMPLLRKSLFTVLAGVSLVIFVGFLIGTLHSAQPLTAEILSRTQPTSMDLMIALAGGTAGAYAMVSPHLSVAVVGVAVATALVPPLAASGILFAHGELSMGFGAALLALTNIIAIQFTNAMVLWLLGFRRLVDDDYKSKTYLTFLRRNAITILLLAGVGSYLTINLQTNAKQQVFESSVKQAINDHFIDQGNVLTNTQFTKANGNQIVRAVVRGETIPNSSDVNKIEAVVTQDMVENYPNYLPIKLQLRYIPVQVIESNPVIRDKLDKTDAAILTN
ncbi:DUF389 domain-containing protein [Psychrobacter sp. M13]|uniref:DUF389 domain-containing protein n=1 Tax=Psychrobacter sp. M13 TaxID=3067275 RepID=UPI00273B189E|nr:DUF389 domain-containing protein [Psychrobacter sp. M13]WLP93540.1 DUF389 domain-containing protein [Psychrobacter sp. M13]